MADHWKGEVCHSRTGLISGVESSSSCWFVDANLLSWGSVQLRFDSLYQTVTVWGGGGRGFPHYRSLCPNVVIYVFILPAPFTPCFGFSFCIAKRLHCSHVCLCLSQRQPPARQSFVCSQECANFSEIPSLKRALWRFRHLKSYQVHTHTPTHTPIHSDSLISWEIRDRFYEQYTFYITIRMWNVSHCLIENCKVSFQVWAVQFLCHYLMAAP